MHMTASETKTETRKTIEEAICIYNHRRLHEKLGYMPRSAPTGGL